MKKPWRNGATLKELYVDRRLSAYEIADELGCGQNAVYTALDDFDIERRSDSEATKCRQNRKPACYRTLGRDGYELWTNTHGDTTYRCCVHKLAAVAWFGFDAVAGSVIHHENRIPWDNREENLTVISDQNQHAKLHHKERQRNEMGQYV